MPPPHMLRQGPPPGRNFQHMEMPMQHHPNIPEHHPLPFRDFPPGPRGPPVPLGPRGPLPPGHDHFMGPPRPPYYNAGPGPMPPGPGPMPPNSRGPPPGGMVPGGQPHWEGPMFQPIYHSHSPYGPSPSPQPRPTPPETPPPMDRPFSTHSPHPHHGPFSRVPREPMMPPHHFPHENPRGFPPRPSPGPPGPGGPQGDRRWHHGYR